MADQTIGCTEIETRLAMQINRNAGFVGDPQHTKNLSRDGIQGEHTEVTSDVVMGN
jgi:hypothetical protein